MARVRCWNGHELVADPIRLEADGRWLMRARQHGSRVVPGTEFYVTPREIIEMSAAEMPADLIESDDDRAARARDVTPVSEGQADLEAAMARERETLPSVASLLAPLHEAARETRSREADAVVAERVRPTMRR